MENRKRITGVLAPALTPFDANLAPDTVRFVRHCKWLLANGCSGLAVFGTTSEANSMSVGEKLELLQALVSDDVPSAALMPGTGHSAFSDTVVMTRRAVEHGCGGVLMLPPFYFKGVSDEGLYRYYAEVIERVGDERLRIYLYHIPPVSQVPITLALIERLLKKYPGIVAGIKDSSGDWQNTLAMLNAFANSGFDVFTGSELLLLDNLRHGGKGCITATGNINPGPIDQLYRQWRSADAERLQAGITAVRTSIQKRPMIPALKAVLAHFSHDPQWRRLRPPLVELAHAREQRLLAELQAMSFEMPGLST